MGYKTVHFHKMSYYKNEIVKKPNKQDEQRTITFPEKSLKSKLADIFKNNLEESCLILEKGNNQVTLEVLSEDDDYLFARLGKMQDIKTVHLRNKKTLVASPIHKAIDQEIEIFTYLILNKQNMIISYITESGAPHIKKLEQIGSRYIKGKYGISVTPIMVHDAIDILKNKKTISKVDYKVSLPSDVLLNKDNLDIPVDDMIALKDLKSATLQITLTGRKNKNIVENIKENVEKLVENIKKNKYGKAEQISMNAKNDNEYTHTYKVFDEYFVQKTRVNTAQIDRKIDELDFDDENYYEKVQGIVHEEIKLKLLGVYQVNEESLEEYSRKSS